MGKHELNICGTALKKLGFIKRVVGRYSDEKVKETCYIALARPHFEYAASLWHLGPKDFTQRLNKIQMKAARLVKNRYERTQSVTQLIEGLGWEPLETRSLPARLVMREKFRSDFMKETLRALYIYRPDKIRLSELEKRNMYDY
jgi:hypothetical protein